MYKIQRVFRTKPFWFWLVCITTFGFLLRFIIFWISSRNEIPAGDQIFYSNQAIDLSRGYGFVYRNDRFNEFVSTAIHPPLYSAWLGFVTFIFRGSNILHKIASIGIGSLTIPVVMITVRKFYDKSTHGVIACIAGFLVALYPNFWSNDVLIVAESLYALTIALVLYFGLQFVSKRNIKHAFLFGLSVALAALTRSEAQLIFIGFAFLFIFQFLIIRKNQSATDKTKNEFGESDIHQSTWSYFSKILVYYVLGYAVLAGPWTFRNLMIFTHPATMTTSTGFVLEVGNCDATYSGKFLGYWSSACDTTAWPIGDETVVAKAKQETAMKYVGSHKREIPKVIGARISRLWDFWSPKQSYDFNVFFERRGEAATFLGLMCWYGLLPFAVIGYRNLIKSKQNVAVLSVIMVVTTISAAMAFGITRYRTAIDVAIIILASIGINVVCNWRNKSKQVQVTHRNEELVTNNYV